MSVVVTFLAEGNQVVKLAVRRIFVLVVDLELRHFFEPTPAVGAGIRQLVVFIPVSFTMFRSWSHDLSEHEGGLY